MKANIMTGKSNRLQSKQMALYLSGLGIVLSLVPSPVASVGAWVPVAFAFWLAIKAKSPLVWAVVATAILAATISLVLLMTHGGTIVTSIGS